MSCDRLKKHLIFDIDGTLLDTDQAVEAALAAATDRHGLPRISSSCIKEHCGLPGLDFLKLIGIPEAEAVFLDWRLELRKYSALIRPYPGIMELLRTLHAAGIPMGVVTSRTKDVAQPDLDALELTGFFQQVITSSDTAAHKPAPDPILLYLQRTGAAPDSCIYIGDTISDCQCAHGAGVPFCLAGWGAFRRTGMEEERVLESPEEVLTLLRGAAHEQ